VSAIKKSLFSSDFTHPGLRIMASPSGAKVWIYRFRDPARKMAQLLIGSFPALSLADARSEWLDRWAEHVAGIVAPRAKPARAKR